jgi:hypothetical protein
MKSEPGIIFDLILTFFPVELRSHQSFRVCYNKLSNQLDNSNLNKDKSIWRGTVAGIIFLLIFSSTVFSPAGNDKNVPGISVDRVKQLLNNSDVIIIDVRKYRNWWRSSKKILSAVRENPFKVDQWAQKYPKDKSLIFY